MLLDKTTLGEISIDNKGYYGIAASAVDYSKELYTYLRITDITDDGRINYTNLKSVNDINAKNYLLKPNDIVFARTGGSTGRNYFYDGNEGEFVYAGFLIKFSLDDKKVNPRFIKYYCQSSKYKNWILSYNTGSTRGNINAQTYANMEIELPPRDYQDRAVLLLDSIENKLLVNTTINNNLEQQAQAIFKSWFVDFKPFGGTMPNDWEISKVENAVTFSQGVQVPVAQQSTTKENGYVQFIRIIDLTQQNTDIRYIPSCNRGNIDYDDIFMIRYGSPGILGRNCRGIIANNLFKIEPKIGLTKNYLFNYFNSSKIQDYIKQNAISSTMPAINFSTLYGKEIIIPTVDIIEKFTRIDEIFRLKLLNINIENQKLIQLRDILLPKLMNGEIDVSKV